MPTSSDLGTGSNVIALIERFTDATNRHDVDGMMALMSDDVVFESTSAPEGRRFEGQAAVRACWDELFRGTPRARFEMEEVIVSGDRCTARWRYVFDGDSADAGCVRGVDVFRITDGKIAEKLSYVKG
jgi:ketosteroid isomerase-like protein